MLAPVVYDANEPHRSPLLLSLRPTGLRPPLRDGEEHPPALSS
jgi:hypothetical protein